MLKKDVVLAMPSAVGITIGPDGEVCVCGESYPRGTSVTVTAAVDGNVRVRVFTPERSPLPAWRENLARARMARKRNRDRGLAPDQALTDAQLREALLGLVRANPGRPASAYTKLTPGDGGVRGDSTRKLAAIRNLVSAGLIRRVPVQEPKRALTYCLVASEVSRGC